MADQLLANTYQNTIANTPQIVFVSSAASMGTLLTAITLSNDTSSSATYRAFIAPATPEPTLPQVPTRIIKTKRTDVPPELSGQVVTKTWALWLETSVAMSISITVSGRELT